MVTPTDREGVRTMAAASVAVDLLDRAVRLLQQIDPLASKATSALGQIDRAVTAAGDAGRAVERAVSDAQGLRDSVSRIAADVATTVVPAAEQARQAAVSVEQDVLSIDALRRATIEAKEAAVATRGPVEQAARDAASAAQSTANDRSGIAALLAGIGIPHRWNGTRIALRLPDGSFGAEVDLAGDVGVPGASAYQLAVANGFVGTIAEWLASLKGSGADGAAVIADGAIDPSTTWSSFKLDAALSAVAASVRPVRYPADIGLRDRTISAEAAPGDTVFELDPDLGLSYRLLVGGSVFDLDEHDRLVFSEAPEGETTYPVEVEALTLEGWRKVFRVSVTTGVLLRLLGLSSASFFDIDPPGTVIGSIQNRHAASIIAEVLSDDRMVVQDDGTTARLIVGDTASAAGDTFASIRETSGTATKTTAIPVRVNQRTKQVVGGVVVSGVESTTNPQIGDRLGGSETITPQSIPIRDRVFPLRLTRSPIIGDVIAFTEVLP